jgi:hypothetical protein
MIYVVIFRIKETNYSSDEGVVVPQRTEDKSHMEDNSKLSQA